MTINKKVLSEEISKALECSKAQALVIIDVTSGIILRALQQDNNVIFGCLGTIKPIHRKARMTINPKTLVKMMTESRTSIKISTSKCARDALNSK